MQPFSVRVCFSGSATFCSSDPVQKSKDLLEMKENLRALSAFFQKLKRVKTGLVL